MKEMARLPSSSQVQQREIPRASGATSPALDQVRIHGPDVVAETVELLKTETVASLDWRRAAPKEFDIGWTLALPLVFACIPLRALNVGKGGGLRVRDSEICFSPHHLLGINLDTLATDERKDRAKRNERIESHIKPATAGNKPVPAVMERQVADKNKPSNAGESFPTQLWADGKRQRRW